MARFSQELPDHPWGFTAEEKAVHLEDIEGHWGERALVEVFFGAIADIPGFRDVYGAVNGQVSSTESLSARGDAQWRQQLDAHDRLVHSVLMKYSGSRVKHTGDGVCSRCWTAPPRQPAAHSNSRPRWLRAAFPFAPVFTWANANGAATSEAAWRCTSAPG
jgi:hypothetical protein